MYGCFWRIKNTKKISENQTFSEEKVVQVFSLTAKMKMLLKIESANMRPASHYHWLLV